MKKLISLVALAGMFLLMSFSTSAMKKTPSEELQDDCYQRALNFVNGWMNEYGDMDSIEQHAMHGDMYDACIEIGE